MQLSWTNATLNIVSNVVCENVHAIVIIKACLSKKCHIPLRVLPHNNEGAIKVCGTKCTSRSSRGGAYYNCRLPHHRQEQCLREVCKIARMTEMSLYPCGDLKWQ